MKEKFNFTLLITATISQEGSYTALRFAETVIKQGHHLQCVFFYDDGVLNALPPCETFSDEINLNATWGKLALEHHFQLLVCATEAAKRGLSSKELPKTSEFKLVGLGQLFENLHLTDRLLVFGG